jgi:Rrf2 family transcriptional regulator, cysteine metabolism repressor
MKLSTRARYGTRALLVLAFNYGKKPVLLKDIAREQDISERYLENIMTLLLANGIIHSTRGKKGGFSLAKAPSGIRMSDVVQVLEGSLTPVACIDHPQSCKRSALCATRDLWKKMNQAMLAVLEATTLQELVELQKKKLAKTGKQMYFI